MSKKAQIVKTQSLFFLFPLQEQERLSVVTTGASGFYMRARARSLAQLRLCVYACGKREREKKKTDNLNVR